VGDPQRGAGAVELRLQRPAAERAEALLRLAVRRERVRVAEPLLEPRQLAVQPPHLAERGAEQAVDREAGAGRLLRQVADAIPRPERHGAAVGRVGAGQQAQQRGLAGAVRSDQAHAARARQRQAQPLEDRVVAAGGGEVGCLQRHGIHIPQQAVWGWPYPAANAPRLAWAA
jgi:hypothetical protein